MNVYKNVCLWNEIWAEASSSKMLWEKGQADGDRNHSSRICSCCWVQMTQNEESPEGSGEFLIWFLLGCVV